MLTRSEWLPSDAFVAALIGPSGVGKSTLAKLLQKNGVATVEPTLATRGMRSGERQDPPCDHKFVAPEYFDTHKLLITRTLYGGLRYGLPRLKRPAEGCVTLLVLKPSFIQELLGHFPRTRIYQIETSAQIAFMRMQDRDQAYNPDDLDRRMREYESEIVEGRRFAHHVFNNDGPLNQTLRTLTEQIHYDWHTLSLPGFAQTSDEPAMLQ